MVKFVGEKYPIKVKQNRTFSKRFSDIFAKIVL